MSKIILPPCCNSKGLPDHPEPLGLAIPACDKGTPAPITLNLWRRHGEEAEVYNLCLPCCEKVETWAEEHDATVRRLNVEPVVGMPATIGIGSDSYPALVTRVSDSGKTISVVKVRYKPTPGHNYFGNQKYEYSEEPEGAEQVWTFRKNGRWYPKGSSVRSGYGLCLGFRRAYSDPHF